MTPLGLLTDWSETEDDATIVFSLENVYCKCNSCQCLIAFFELGFSSNYQCRDFMPNIETNGRLLLCFQSSLSTRLASSRLVSSQ